MEKELNFNHLDNTINFYYEDLDLNEEQLKEYSRSCELMIKAISEFKNETLKLTDFSFQLNLNICDDKRIIQLNSEYRGKDKITDVLSFPLQENIRNQEFEKMIPELELGDIYVCESICLKQSEEFTLSYQEEFIHLTLHGFLHLCGYDHEISNEEEKLMESLEEKLINLIKTYQ